MLVDRSLADELAALAADIRSGKFLNAVEGALGGALI
jgi:hypothetical protein